MHTDTSNYELTSQTPEDSDTTVLHSKFRHSSPWFDYATWYRVHPNRVETTDDVLTLIATGARHGIRTITVPGIAPDGDPRYRDRVLSKAQQREIRILVDISSEMYEAYGIASPFSYENLTDLVHLWIESGARGIELGNFSCFTDSQDITVFGTHRLASLEKLVNVLDPEAAISIGFPQITDEILNAWLDTNFYNIVRAEFHIQDHTIESFTSYLQKTYATFDQFNRMTTWNLRPDILNEAHHTLSASARVCIILALPGIVYFESKAMGYSPFTRHALRLRETLALHNASIAVAHNSQPGVCHLLVGPIEIRINVERSEGEILPPDCEILLSSSGNLPMADDGTSRILPLGEVVWIDHRSTSRS
ncbi:hypothetical protein [Arcanobacterium ihumii]|uniref:hypothetical protein n=1 Tax=Arcanobacterium ihumii TaxID=2138162 RepID=UPI000F53D91B|nr:hypothetical protein [Arcanobacterium ihumii]